MASLTKEQAAELMEQELQERTCWKWKVLPRNVAIVSKTDALHVYASQHKHVTMILYWDPIFEEVCGFRTTNM